MIHKGSNRLCWSMVRWQTFDNPDLHLAILDNLDIGNMSFASINEGGHLGSPHLVQLLRFFHILLLREGSRMLSSLSDGCPPWLGFPCQNIGKSRLLSRVCSEKNKVLSRVFTETEIHSTPNRTCAGIALVSTAHAPPLRTRLCLFFVRGFKGGVPHAKTGHSAFTCGFDKIK